MNDVVSPSEARLPTSPLPYIIVNVVLTGVFVAIELPLIWVNGVEAVRFWVAIAWIFGDIVSTFVFVRTNRVVANRSYVSTALWAIAMGLVVPIGWTTVFHTPGAALRWLIFSNTLGPLAITVIYCVVLCIPRGPRANWLLGIPWSLLFIADAYMAISLKIYCCDWM